MKASISGQGASRGLHCDHVLLSGVARGLRQTLVIIALERRRTACNYRRYLHHEARALARFTLHPNSTAEGFDQVARNRQAQTSSAKAAANAGVSLHKWLKHPRQ